MALTYRLATVAVSATLLLGSGASAIASSATAAPAVATPAIAAASASAENVESLPFAVIKGIEAPTQAAATPAPTAAPAPVRTQGTSRSQSRTPVASGAGLNLARAAMWDRIARCESGGNWQINTGNGYYGGLQFALASWRANGGTDFAAYPHKATRAQQITVANRYYAKAGLAPWGCRHAA